jgi:hypothetical protein
MLTLVAAVDVYDLAAEGATDAFELLSSPRVSRYAISWTSVEKDIVAMNWRLGSVSPYCEPLKPQRSPASRTKEVFSNEIANRGTARVQPFKGFGAAMSKMVRRGTALAGLPAAKIRKLSNAVRVKSDGVWGPDVVHQICQVRRIFVRFQRFFPSRMFNGISERDISAQNRC